MNVERLAKKYEFAIARNRINLQLPNPTNELLADAQKAVHKEYLASSRWKLLDCIKVSGLTGDDSETLFVLDVGHSVEFDWTWEGATAFTRTQDEDSETLDSLDESGDSFGEDSEPPSRNWKGEVVEVDETNGKIYVCITDRKSKPEPGPFYIKPFEFLAFLNAVMNNQKFESYRKLLPPRLHAAEGDVHPPIKNCKPIGLDHLNSVWGSQWGVLWGPPGTGKTYTIGQQVARVLSDPTERILVVSTTNRATDVLAISIGEAAKKHAKKQLGNHQLLRLGKGASLKSFQDANLEAMLKGTEMEFLAALEEKLMRLSKSKRSKDKAVIRKEIAELLEVMRDASTRNFLDDEVRVVVSTAFRATIFLNTIKELIEEHEVPFTTIIIDEAGLLSRAAIAALSLLASKRVLLVGDSKQLAPISRISRVLASDQKKWLAMSGLSHLHSTKQCVQGIHVLTEQRRMHADICRIVSDYQYDSCLSTAQDVMTRKENVPKVLAKQPRAIWNVLDGNRDNLSSIRAKRGPGNRSWIRTASTDFLKVLLSDAEIREREGLFVSPYKAQTIEVARLFASMENCQWRSSTIHSQQGSEADIVVFDTVNAGSHGWSYDDWQRLVNVAISRARQNLIVLASRAEMREPYLQPLVANLTSMSLEKTAKRPTWNEVPAQGGLEVGWGTDLFQMRLDFNDQQSGKELCNLGYQLEQRKRMRPILSSEQQRLCEIEYDGEPRLVNGIAGSGKTIVLAHWVVNAVRKLKEKPQARIWVVFANRSLQSLIAEAIANVWVQQMGSRAFPWELVELRHVMEILRDLLPQAGMIIEDYGYEFDKASEVFSWSNESEIQPKCDAMFVDEGQDFGTHTLKLLMQLIRKPKQCSKANPSMSIFHDSAQDIYRRGEPLWPEIGFDKSDRTETMVESYRSTRPIMEFAYNVLWQLDCDKGDEFTHQELERRGLITKDRRNGIDWWNVLFSQVDGIIPEIQHCRSIPDQFNAVADYCRHLIIDEQVKTSDICILVPSWNIGLDLENGTKESLRKFGVELSLQTSRALKVLDNQILATTPHSFKGYDAEVVIMPFINKYMIPTGGIAAKNLYVGMTRARSVLRIIASRSRQDESIYLYKVLDRCLESLKMPFPQLTKDVEETKLRDLVQRIGKDKEEWISSITTRYQILQEPLIIDAKKIAEPVFWFQVGRGGYAYFGDKRPNRTVLRNMKLYCYEVLEENEQVELPYYRRGLRQAPS